jgi:hypothetical protein
LAAEEFQRLAEGIKEASVLLRKSQSERGTSQKRELVAKVKALSDAASSLGEAITKSIEKKSSQFDLELRQLATEKSVAVEGAFPKYALSSASTRIEVEVLDPFVTARVGFNLVDSASPLKLISLVKARQTEKVETDLARFARIFKLSYMSLAQISSTDIVKLKDVLAVTNSAYARVGFDQESAALLQQAMDAGTLKAELEPGRDPKSLVQLRLAGEERYFQWIRMREQ